MTNTQNSITVRGVTYAIAPAPSAFAAYPNNINGKRFAEGMARLKRGECVDTGNGYAYRVAGWEYGTRGTKRPVAA